MELIERPRQLTFDHTAVVFDGVAADQWDDTTPVRGMGRAGPGRPHARRGREHGPDRPRRGAARGREHHRARCRIRRPGSGPSRATTLAAWRAADLDAPLDFGGGRMVPTRFAVMVNLLDTSTHSWDLARATGQPEELPAGVAEVGARVGPGGRRATRSGAPAASIPAITPPVGRVRRPSSWSRSSAGGP